MKKQYLFLSLMSAGTFIFLSFQNADNPGIEKYNSNYVHKKSSNGSQLNKTGAPGEQNCFECHTGGTAPTLLAGASQNMLKVFDGGTEVTSYVPGTTYKVTLTLATGDVREGFAATALLDSDDTAAGAFPGTGLVGAQVNTNLGRFYASHTSSSNSSANVSWEWDWTAPSTDLGSVTFYVSSNIANGNNNFNGDQIFISQHVINSTLSLSEDQKASINFISGFNAQNNELMISYSSLTKEAGFINIVDLSGKSVYEKQIGYSNIGSNKKTIKLDKEIPHGTYILQFFLGNNPVTSKIIF